MIYEYIWLDGSEVPQLRSKVKVSTQPEAPIWAFDGSSTGQAETKTSDLLLIPKVTAKSPLHDVAYVLCEVYEKDKPHKSNIRSKLIETEKAFSGLHLWLGFEQEYVFIKDGRPLGWEKDKEPAPQGPYYCGIGQDNVDSARQVVEEHMRLCFAYGLHYRGYNAEVMKGQWEFQIGPDETTEEKDFRARGSYWADELWLARYLLQKTAEKHGLAVNLDPKPIRKGDFNGSGCHTNFSTIAMRSGDLVKAKHSTIQEKYVEALREKHKHHIAVYGKDNNFRLTGKHETCSITEFRSGNSDRGSSIRIPPSGKYLEDRRPAANCDPYQVAWVLTETLGAVK